MENENADNASVAERLGGQATTFAVSDGKTKCGHLQGYVAGPLFDSEASKPASEQATHPVILVHGWPEFAGCWESIATSLVCAGYSIVAYDQRGYSPGLRPQAFEEYTIEKLVDDLKVVADSVAGQVGSERFHLVGHDWGAVMGWAAVPALQGRIATFTALSAAHTTAHSKMIANDPEQYQRMEYLRKIRHHPHQVAQSMLRDGARKLRDIYGDAVPQDTVDEYVRRLSQPGVLDATLNYYRALGHGTEMPVELIDVPTLYIWGTEDVAFTRSSAELTANYVTGPYTFVELPGGSHWIPEENPGAAAHYILRHLRNTSSHLRQKSNSTTYSAE